MRKATGIIAGALVAAVAWASPARAIDPRITQEKSAATQRAQAVTSGVVAENKGSQIVVTPYAGGQAITVSVSGDVPVFQGKGKITSKGLMKNVNVRVHHLAASGGVAQATAIEVLTPDEARELAKRALKFKQERGRLPDITSADPWEKRMAEGVAFLARMKQEQKNG